MSNISLVSIKVLNPEAHFLDDFQFEIAFNCVEPLAEDLEWKLVYLGSPHDKSLDQELDSILLGPVVKGLNKFVFQTPGPDPEKIPKSEPILGATGIIVSCAYKDQEFLSIGYYVHNELEGAKKEMEQITEELLPFKDRGVFKTEKKEDVMDESKSRPITDDEKSAPNSDLEEEEDEEGEEKEEEKEEIKEEEEKEEEESNDQPINLEEECLEGEVKDKEETSIPRDKLDLKKVVRSILDTPRITVKEIKWQ